MFGNGIEPIADFAKALKAEKERIRKNWEWIYHYRNAGFYFRQLKRYTDIFNNRQIKVYLFEDFINNAHGIIRDIFRFLEVDDVFVPDVSRRRMETYKPKSTWLHRSIFAPKTLRYGIRFMLQTTGLFNVINRTRNKLINWNAGDEAPPIASEARLDLIEGYRQDILNLQDLIKRDLSGWLK
jgi:hypothetical protein